VNTVSTAGPVTALPPNYHEVHYISINKPGVLIWLNVLSLIPLVIAGLLFFGALLVYHEELGAPLVIDAIPSRIPSLLGLALVLGVLPLHEWAHGLAISHYGHRPRYGFKWAVLFATSDGALFRRREFVWIALAPLISISVIGLVVMLFVPGAVASWIVFAMTLNAAGAIGDIWMTMVALRFDSAILIRDEEDSMRIFAPASEPIIV
jgi:hypothetical protein